MEEYNFNELTFKQFKDLVIDACFNNLLIVKKEVLKKSLKFKDERAKDYYKCGSYICYFKYKGVEYQLVYIFPPATCWVIKTNYTFEEYKTKKEYESIEECIRSFLNENKV